ncbi:MAG: hypothetical protein KatS3mg085_286 [Candidatus Dojkabacteria bacterium]|nr:MAG: hypothetical protein KatS3mg085_286 [Candidatus Dojkabacteria bacterium]GIW58896.1 MAG: hypothetical protein KatS3mg086_181 [Candidatus Dojkabacteria bacterium]
MKIFVATPHNFRETLQIYYDLIEQELKKFSCKVLVSNFEGSKKLLKPIEMNSLRDDEDIHYETIEKGILWADILIFELTAQDLLLGYHLNNALNLKKNTLGLSLKTNINKKINNDHFESKIYNKNNLKTILKEFLIKSEPLPLNIRFNMFLSQTHETYLNCQSKKHNISKSDYIRDLIEKDMLKGD